jgi:hypothetical protein
VPELALDHHQRHTPAGHLDSVRMPELMGCEPSPDTSFRGGVAELDDNPQLPVIGLMCGIRNLSLAAGLYAATGANRAQWWRLQPAVDALDLLAIAAEWRRGAIPGPAAALMAGTALGATTLGALSFTGESLG